MKFWFGDRPRDQAHQRFSFGETSSIFVVHHAYDWHFRLYCFDFDAGVKATIGTHEMPAALKTFLCNGATDYDAFQDVSPQLPPQLGDECAARVVCFAKWFARSRTDGFTDRFDEALYLRSVQNRMTDWRQVRAKIAKGESVPKLALSPLCKLCHYDKCPTSVIGLPARLTNTNSMCFLNQALVVLATSGPWSAKPNDDVGHLLVQVLLISCLDNETEEMRNSLAQMLFFESESESEAGWGAFGDSYSGEQQCIEECLRKMCDHLTGPVVTEVNSYTCSVCNASTQTSETTSMFFTKEGIEEVMSLTALIDMDQSDVHWRCSTPNCLAAENGQKKFALGSTFMNGALPNTIIVVCKRSQFQDRLATDIQIPFDVPVKTTNESCDTISELYSPVYVVLHSAGGIPAKKNSRRSRYNVPDTDEASVRHARGGHYFGAVLDTLARVDPDDDKLDMGDRARAYQSNVAESGIVYLDDDKLDKGTRAELVSQGQKVVVAVLRKKSLGQGTVDLYPHALVKAFEAHLASMELVKEWSPRHAASFYLCHRVANHVFIFLKENDEALPCFDQASLESRPRIVSELFKNSQTEQTRRVILTAIAIMWQVRITVHKFQGDPEIFFGTNDSTGKFTLFLHGGVLFPTSGAVEQATAIVTTSSGLRLGLLATRGSTRGSSARGSSARHVAVFDTIIPIVCPLTCMLAAHDPGNVNLLAFDRLMLDKNKLPTLPSLPTNRHTTYWHARNLVAGLCNGEASLLMRSSPKSTGIECSYSMIWQVVQTIERFVPFTDQSTHLILGCGRRGALLDYLMIGKDITLVGLDVSHDAITESNQLIARVQAADPHFLPKIHVELMNVETLTSMHGFTSASRFAGGTGAGTSDHTARNATDEMALCSPTMQVYWNNHLNNLNNLTLSDQIKSEWKLVILSGTAQEQSRFSTYLWLRVQPSHTSTRISSHVTTLVAAAQKCTKRDLLQHDTPSVRTSQRVQSKKGSPRTPGADGAQGNPVNVSPEANKASPRTPGTDVAPERSVNATEATTPARRRRAGTPDSTAVAASKRQPQTPKATRSPDATEIASVATESYTRKRPKSGQEDGMNDSGIAAFLKDAGRNLANEFEKTHQKMLAEIKRSNQAISTRLLEAEKKGLSKPALAELVKQITAKTSAQFETKLAATHAAVERLPTILTSQMRSAEITKAGGPRATPEGVSAELRVALSQLPAAFAKALAPTGTQDYVHKAITDLAAGLATKDRDLLWIEQKRVEDLRKKNKKKKKKRKEKLARKAKEKEQKMKEDKKERKIAQKEKEDRRNQELDKEKEKFLALLKQTGALRKDSTSQDSARGKQSRSSSQDSSIASESCKRSGRKRSRSRDRARRRQNSRSSSQESTSTSRSRSRDRARRRRKRSRDRSKKRTSRDRDCKPRNNQSVLQANEAGVGEWLERIHLGSFRKIFSQSNIVGADLKGLSSSTLQGYGMEDHQLRRFVDAVKAL